MGLDWKSPILLRILIFQPIWTGSKFSWQDCYKSHHLPSVQVLVVWTLAQPVEGLHKALQAKFVPGQTMLINFNWTSLSTFLSYPHYDLLYNWWATPVSCLVQAAFSLSAGQMLSSPAGPGVIQNVQNVPNDVHLNAIYLVLGKFKTSEL